MFRQQWKTVVGDAGDWEEFYFLWPEPDQGRPMHSHVDQILTCLHQLFSQTVVPPSVQGYTVYSLPHGLNKAFVNMILTLLTHLMIHWYPLWPFPMRVFAVDSHPGHTASLMAQVGICLHIPRLPRHCHYPEGLLSSHVWAIQLCSFCPLLFWLLVASPPSHFIHSFLWLHTLDLVTFWNRSASEVIKFTPLTLWPQLFSPSNSLTCSQLSGSPTHWPPLLCPTWSAALSLLSSLFTQIPQLSIQQLLELECHCSTVFWSHTDHKPILKDYQFQPADQGHCKFMQMDFSIDASSAQFPATTCCFAFQVSCLFSRRCFKYSPLFFKPKPLPALSCSARTKAMTRALLSFSIMKPVNRHARSLSFLVKVSSFSLSGFSQDL